MTCSKLKILFYLTISLMLLFAPFLLEISPGGNTYAFSSRSHNKSSNTGDKDTFGYDGPTETPVRVPEPAPLLLIGGGLIGIAALRKKFKKK
jgi:hypothetical protein